MKRLFLALAATFVAVSAQAQAQMHEFCISMMMQMQMDPSTITPREKERYNKSCVSNKKQENNKTVSSSQSATPSPGSLVLSHNEVGQVRLMCMKLRGANPPALCTDPRLEAAAQAGL